MSLHRRQELSVNAISSQSSHGLVSNRLATEVAGGARTRDREAARQDRAIDGGAGFFSQEVRKMSPPDRRALVDSKPGGLSVLRQCQLLGLARSGVYRLAAPANGNDLLVMRRLDELFTLWPFLGSRRMAKML